MKERGITVVTNASVVMGPVVDRMVINYSILSDERWGAGWQFM